MPISKKTTQDSSDDKVTLQDDSNDQIVKQLVNNFVPIFSGISRDVRDISKISYDEVLLAVANPILGIYGDEVRHNKTINQPYRAVYKKAVDDMEYVANLIYQKLSDRSKESSD